jgi:hypothetical protein
MHFAVFGICGGFTNGLMIFDKSEDGTPLFLLIKYILHHVGLVIVCGTSVIADKFLAHYHAFKLLRTNEWIAVVPAEGISHHLVISSYDVDDGEVVVLQHCI